MALDDAVGKHDGEVKGTRYFRCSPSHGVLVRTERLLVPPSRQAVQYAAQSESAESAHAEQSSRQLQQIATLTAEAAQMEATVAQLSADLRKATHSEVRARTDKRGLEEQLTQTTQSQEAATAERAREADSRKAVEARCATLAQEVARERAENTRLSSYFKTKGAKRSAMSLEAREAAVMGREQVGPTHSLFTLQQLSCLYVAVC